MSDTLYVFKKGSSQVDAVVKMDCTLDEKVSTKWTPTKRAVESGANINRYVTKEPQEYSATGLLTATPMSGGEDLERIRKIVEELENLGDKREIVTVVFGLWVFDAVITSVDESTSASDGNCIRLNLSFQEIEEVAAQTTQIPPSRLKPKQRRQKSSKKGGKETGKTASPKTEKKAKSWLKSGKDVVKSLLRK